MMDRRSEVRQFLVSRRARITPAQAGLPERGNRRVPGLRRSEVAALARVSVEYYTKIERGDLTGASAWRGDDSISALRPRTAAARHADRVGMDEGSGEEPHVNGVPLPSRRVTPLRPSPCVGDSSTTVAETVRLRHSQFFDAAFAPVTGTSCRGSIIRSHPIIHPKMDKMENFD